MPSDVFQRPSVWACLDGVHEGMVRDQVVVAGLTYRVSRTGVLVLRDGACEVLLAGEPVIAAVHAMLRSRGSWDAAFAERATHEELWRLADQSRLMENLRDRDKVRHYDEGKRLIHLSLVIDAIVPNLVETVAMDLGAILEIALAHQLEGEVLAVVSLRQETEINLRPSFEDETFAQRIAPLHIILCSDSGPARAIKVGDDAQGIPRPVK